MRSKIIRLLLIFMVGIGIAVGVWSNSQRMSKTSPQTAIREMDFPVITEFETCEFSNCDYHSIRSLAWNPSGATIAIGTEGLETVLYGLETRAQTRIHGSIITNPVLAWNSTGTLIAGGDGEFWVWDVERNSLVFELSSGGDLNLYRNVMWHPDRALVAATLWGDEIYVRVADIVNNNVKDISVNGWKYTALRGWSSDAKQMLVSDLDGTVALLDPDTLDINRFSGLRERSILCCPVSSRIVSSPVSSHIVVQENENRFVVWNMLDEEQIAQLPYSEAIDFQWSPDGRYMAIAGERGVWLWNIASGIVLLAQSDKALAVDWSPDGSQLVTHIDSTMLIYDVGDLP